MTMTAKGLAKLIEECGELTQVAGKLLAWWDTDEPHWDGSDLRQRLAEEMGDVAAAIEFVSSMFGVHDETSKRSALKHRLFCEWHADPNNGEHAIDASPFPPIDSVPTIAFKGNPIVLRTSAGWVGIVPEGYHYG